MIKVDVAKWGVGKEGVVCIAGVGSNNIEKGHAVGADDVYDFAGNKPVLVESGGAKIQVGPFGRVGELKSVGIKLSFQIGVQTGEAQLAAGGFGDGGFDPADALFVAVAPVVGFILFGGLTDAAGNETVEIDILVGMELHHSLAG